MSGDDRLILPAGYRNKATREKNDEKRRWQERVYRQHHQFCPQCGSGLVEQTCVAVLHPGKPYDNNNAHCLTCNWHGIVDDLVAVPYDIQNTRQVDQNKG